jgi:hypothetical protein
MLEIRPICENCGKSLPANSTEAMICSFECTFCVPCVANVLEDVCPNCGGGFVRRPVRPSVNWRGDNYLGKYPATITVKLRPIDVKAHREFAKSIKGTPPPER